MIAAICEFFIEIVFELFIEMFAELSLEIGFESLSHSLRSGRRANPILAYLGIVILGSILGLLGSLVFSERILQHAPVKGVSLILSPVLAGFLMNTFGNWRRNNGHHTSRLATFWGGALFAFSLALVRWLMVGRLGE